ncbi:MAG TPA: hypothetical protein VMT63_04840 [Bacteroidales bacterium]|nr:hypothetical protein [Bacteroidales bacterium]
MPELTFSQVERITFDISREEISFSHLLDELIDHVCCSVEDEMQQGLEFEDAYRLVKKKIGSRRFREIQEETLYAVDTKYRIMKNTMKISAIAGTLLLGVAATFKIQHWPLAGILATLGAFITAFVFMPSALIVLWKETHSGKRLFLYISAFITALLFICGTLFKIQHWPFAGMMLTVAAACGVFCLVPSLLFSKLKDNQEPKKRLLYILGAVGLIFYILGLLFKLQHWPAATIMMVLGLIFLAIIVFPWYTFITWKEEQATNAKFIFMVIGLIAIVVPAALVTLSLQRSYESQFFAHQSEQQALYSYLFYKNQQFVRDNTRQEVQQSLNQVRSETNDLLKFINGIESGMISVSEGSVEKPALLSDQVKQTESGLQVQFNSLKQTFSRDAVAVFLYPGTSNRKELETRLRDYSAHLSALCHQGEDKKFEKLLEPSVCLPGDNRDNRWTTLMAGLHSLALLKNSILVAESVAFQAVSHK